MRRIAIVAFALASSAAASFAQQWEFGGMAGAGFLSNVNVSGTAGSATAGFKPGGVFGVFVGQNLYTHFSGELRYAYMQNDLHIKTGSTDDTFSGNAHVLHYDLVWHTAREGSRMQMFVAAGGGLKVFRGTGTEASYQINQRFGYMTKTQQLKPMASVGAGVRFTLSSHVYLRAEFRDYITPFPKDIITPAPNTKFGSILNDFVPMVSVSYEK